MTRLKELYIKKLKGTLEIGEETELDLLLLKTRKRRGALIKKLQREKEKGKADNSDISKFAQALNRIPYISSYDRKSCVHFDRTGGQSYNPAKAKRHNLREYETPEKEPNYLLPEIYRKENEFWNLTDDIGEAGLPENIFKAEIANYKKKGGRPKLENADKECIIVLNESHTLDDLHKVKEALEKILNITCYRIAIHRDEGHITKAGNPCINYHAHLNFVTIKNGKNNFRLTHTKKLMPFVQTKIAEILKMPRGDYNSIMKHKQPQEYRELMEYKEKVVELKKAIKKLAKDKDSSKTKAKAQINELKKQIKTIKTPKFNRKLAHDHLKLEIYPKLEKRFDKLGIDKEQPIRKRLFAIIADYAKTFDTHKISFENFCEQIKLYENAYLEPLEKQRQQENSYIAELEKDLNDKKAENEKLKAQLNAENKALKENPTKAAEAHQEKAAEQKIEAADIPPQNAKDSSKIVENEKKVENPQEKEKVIEIDYMQDYLIVACLKLEKTYQESNSKWNVYLPETKKRVAREVKSLMNEIDEHLKSRYYQDLTNPQVRECVEKAGKTLKEFKTGDKRAFLEKIGSLLKSQSK